MVVKWHRRFVQLSSLPKDRKTTTVRDAIVPKITRLPQDLLQSPTCDRCQEIANHVQFGVGTGTRVYFGDPDACWQRGTVEKADPLRNQYLPRKLDFSQIT